MTSLSRFLLLAGIALLAPQRPLAAQGADSAAAPLAVYLDCRSSGCDFDFFRTELTMVNWVRDRQVADVHILVTTQETGAGGREYVATFIGLRRFEGLTDTLKHVSEPAATEDARRRGLARLFRLGLVRYLARTPAAGALTISYTAPAGASAQTTAKKDRWNYWVFRTSLNGNFNGEKTYFSLGLHGNVNADRVTETWKTRINAYEQYDQSEFEIDPAQPRFVNLQRRYGGSVLQVRSISQHWSAGMRVNAFSSTYENHRLGVTLLPALEYNLFPYRESTRRQLRMEYNVGYSQRGYHDTTIFDRISEGMPLHRLTVSGAARETWGSVDLGSQATQYLDDPNRYRVGIFGEVSLRLFRGFNLNGFGSYDMIRDQFNLAKKDFTPEEILTRSFQRGTGFRYFGFFGVSYTFGSIFNNVVNPRMGGGWFD